MVDKGRRKYVQIKAGYQVFFSDFSKKTAGN